MSEAAPILEETRSILNRQLTEIRDQRHQALRVIRVYFAGAALIIALLTTLITTSISIPFQLEMTSRGLVGPIGIFIAGILLIRGILTFYRGIFNALEVLSVKSLEKHMWLKLIQIVYQAIIKKEVPTRAEKRAKVSPNIEEIKENPSVSKLIQQNFENIKYNEDVIESNNDGLVMMYDRMASGIIGFGIGLLILFIVLHEIVP